MVAFSRDFPQGRGPRMPDRLASSAVSGRWQPLAAPAEDELSYAVGYPGLGEVLLIELAIGDDDSVVLARYMERGVIGCQAPALVAGAGPVASFHVGHARLADVEIIGGGDLMTGVVEPLQGRGVTPSGATVVFR